MGVFQVDAGDTEAVEHDAGDAGVDGADRGGLEDVVVGAGDGVGGAEEGSFAQGAEGTGAAIVDESVSASAEGEVEFGLGAENISRAERLLFGVESELEGVLETEGGICFCPSLLGGRAAGASVRVDELAEESAFGTSRGQQGRFREAFFWHG